MVRVSKIQLGNFLNHKDTVVDLPPTGIVVITGGNGHGKSAIMEAASFALWGKMLRGSDPKGDTPGVARVSLGGPQDPNHYTVERAFSSRGVKLSVVDGGSDWAAATTTKMQERLDGAIGDWDVWRRTHAFSSSDVAHYSLATDIEQKRMIEDLLGLDTFDHATKLCGDDERDTNTQVDRLKLQVGGLHDRIKDAWEHLTQSAPELMRFNEEEAESERSRLHAEVSGFEARYRTACSWHNSVEVEVNTAKAASKSASDRRSNLQRHSVCPTCEQSVPKEKWDEIEAGLSKDVQQANTCVRETLQAKIRAERVLEERAEAYRRHQVVVQHLVEQTRHFQATKQAIEHFDKNHAEGMNKVAELEAQVAVLEEQQLDAWLNQEVLGWCKKTIRAMRTVILGQALIGLEASANAWLDTIVGAGVKLVFNTLTEAKSKKGQMLEKFSIDVEGIAGGKGYKGASAGQRRRIDVAILFALADMAAAAKGVQPGTLFVDEVFDVLDEEGTDAVARVLQQMAETRCVVVISHNQSLVEQLPAVLRVTVEDGSVV